MIVCFIPSFLFVSGIIYGHVVGLSLILVYVSFALSLKIKDKKVTKEINKKLKLDARNFLSSQLYYGVISDGLVPLFAHVDFGADRERPSFENNYGVLYYETINSLFMVFKAYLDILEKIILNQCDKYLLPALLTSENDRSC